MQSERGREKQRQRERREKRERFENALLSLVLKARAQERSAGSLLF